MTPSEKVALGKALEALERESARKRQAHGQTAPGRNASENFTEVPKGDTRDIVGKAIGMSGPTYQRAKAGPGCVQSESREAANMGVFGV